MVSCKNYKIGNENTGKANRSSSAGIDINHI
jgi:hypothetical protein